MLLGKTTKIGINCQSSRRNDYYDYRKVEIFQCFAFFKGNIRRSWKCVFETFPKLSNFDKMQLLMIVNCIDRSCLHGPKDNR